MERDQHSGPEQGTGDRAPDPGAGLSDAGLTDEVTDTREAAQAEAEATVTKAAEPPVPESDPSVRADAIMSKLPRTRPQRVTGRRHREQARQAPRPGREAPAASQEASPAPRGAKRAPAQGSTAARPKARAGTAARAAKQPKRGTAGAGTTPAPSARPARRRPAAVPVVTQAATPRDPVRRRAETDAPGLARLAVDGAVEAAKLPLRVGGRLTLRALEAAARGLRGR